MKHSSHTGVPRAVTVGLGVPYTSRLLSTSHHWLASPNESMPSDGYFWVTVPAPTPSCGVCVRIGNGACVPYVHRAVRVFMRSSRRAPAHARCARCALRAAARGRARVRGRV